MSEKNGNQETQESGAKEKDAPARENVGDILRKERLTRRITVETIAKDLKLNVNYVKALESSDYTLLPPEPYIRVYIKSLTKYLSLDTENILREFDKERGIISDAVDKSANKIDISVQQKEKSSTFIIAAALLVVLAMFAFIANQKGWLTQPEDAIPAIEEKADTASINHDSLSSLEDSAIAIMGAPESSAVSKSKAPPKP
jgi:cytoskeletal protein RodZ